ncbi:hypothetical protein E2P81_ATG05507 [Venturia nashicola]|nr:hypothetical protein E2P81_ATG05507 [Venturia nashicola]
MNNHIPFIIPNGLPHPATLRTSQPQPPRTNKRSASPEWYYDNYYNRKFKVARRSPETGSMVPTTLPSQAADSSSRMQAGYVLSRETGSVLPITPPLQAKDSLSGRERGHSRRDVPHPKHGLLEATKDQGMPPPDTNKPLSSNTTVTATQPAPQFTGRQVSRPVIVVRFWSRQYDDFVFKTKRLHIEPLPQLRRSPRHTKDGEIARPSIEQEDPLWSARYEVASSTYKVTQSRFCDLVKRSAFLKHVDVVHPDVTLAITDLMKQLHEERPEEHAELAWEVREFFESPFHRVPGVETLLDYLILKAGLADLPDDEMLSDIERDCFRAALEEKIDEYSRLLYENGIEVVENSENIEDMEGIEVVEEQEDGKQQITDQ